MCDILIDVFTVAFCSMVQHSFRDGGGDHSAIVHQSDQDYCRESHAYARGCLPLTLSDSNS